MPEDNVESEGSYSPIPEEKMETKEEKTETKYLSVDTKIDEQKGEKYLALEAEEEKTWWDNQTNRTIVAVFISIAFIALIAALVFLLPCTEDDSELTTNEPNTTVFTEILTGYEEWPGKQPILPTQAYMQTRRQPILLPRCMQTCIVWKSGKWGELSASTEHFYNWWKEANFNN